MKTVVGYKQLKNELLKYKDKKAEVKQTVEFWITSEKIWITGVQNSSAIV